MRDIKGQWQNEWAGHFLSQQWDSEAYSQDPDARDIMTHHKERHRRGLYPGSLHQVENFPEAIDDKSQQRISMAMATQHDVLTGLLNRYQFEIRMQDAFDKNQQKHVEHAVICMDLDQFKVVNDACGHTAGDDLLRQVAVIIQHKVRKWDLVARLGGDEFAIQLFYCNQSQAMRIADDIAVAISQHRFTWQGLSYVISASIGLVMVNDQDYDAQDIMRKADIACNLAKEQGRDRIYVFNDKDEFLNTRHGELHCVADVNQALDEDRFELFFQKILPIDPSEAKSDHYEILVRMRDRNDQFLSPGLFLPAAERYNLIAKIDRWVVKHTCEMLAEHPQHLEQLSVCAINLSGQALNDERFYDYVLDILNQNHIPPEKLCFEITETGVIAHLDNAIKFIKNLRGLGMHFALDDFGSGLSSFAYLRQLPVDYVKIDGMFVKEIEHEPQDLALVKSINEMGHIMGKKTVAEFVENDNILSLLRGVGVDYAQGYGVAKPMQFSEFLRRRS